MLAFHDGLVRDARPGHRLDLSFMITGSSAPVASFRLAAGQGVLCDMASVLVRDPPIELRSWSGVGGGLMLAVNSAPEPSRLLLMSGVHGRLGGFELSEFGGRLLVAREALLAAGPGVAVAVYAHRLGERGDGRPPLSVYGLQGAGWAFLRARGDMIEEEIKAGARISVRAATLVAATAGVDMDPVDGRRSELLLRGPGRVWLQTGIAAVWDDKPPAPARAVPTPFPIETRAAS